MDIQGIIGLLHLSLQNPNIAFAEKEDMGLKKPDPIRAMTHEPRCTAQQHAGILQIVASGFSLIFTSHV